MEEIRNNESEQGTVRRSFFKQAGFLGLGAAATAFITGEGFQVKAAVGDTQTPPDLPPQILAAALIAEDLATCFYYYGLTTPAIIATPSLAGTDGTATTVATDGSIGNVGYLRSALSQEIAHANVLRSLLNTYGVAIPDAAHDPYQTFYFPDSYVADLPSFLKGIEEFEQAFIGAYLVAIQELSAVAIINEGKLIAGIPRTLHPYFCKVAASIACVEAEHRALGRVIGRQNPANNRSFEQTATFTGVYSGGVSAVSILSAFLSPSGGTAVSLADALAAAPTLGLAGDPAGDSLPDSRIG